MKKITLNTAATSILVSAMLVAPFSVQADWWETTKQTAGEGWEATKQATGEAWDATSKTVSEWTQEANESETMKSVKEGAGEVVDTVSDKQTYINAWEATKETAGEAKEMVVKAYEEAKTTNDTPASGE